MTKDTKRIITLERNDALSPRVGQLYSMMERVRRNLLKRIESLSTGAIDYSPDEKKIETTGTLLLHVAAIEWSWIFEDIVGKEMEYEKWKHAFALREDIDQIAGEEIGFYLDRLSQVRSEVFTFLKTMNDEKLDSLVDTDFGKVSMEWILFHLIEHEAMHIGQISFLTRLSRKDGR